jgi:hypothetical protein
MIREAEILEFERRSRSNQRPDLIIHENDPAETAKELARHLARHNVVLSNGNHPVRVVAEADKMPRAVEMTAESVCVYAHEICCPVKLMKGGLTVPTALKSGHAQLYLNGLEGRWGLKLLQGITTSPILADDGSIRVADGYDESSGLWCHSIPVLDVPNTPSGIEAKSALERLRFVFRTFPFADGERVHDPVLCLDVIDPTKSIGLDESTFLVALLTAVCRQSLELAPGVLIDAPSFSGAGCGKGLLVKAICVIASGARPSAFTSGHDTSEFDKRLTAALVEAQPAVFLDNFNAKELRSDILASVLTENPARVRVLGHTKMVPLHVRTFVGITGNGVEIAEDMARRLLKIRLDAQVENPESRKFRPGFLEEIADMRATLLADALTIWRWGRQHRAALTTGRPLGSYETWSNWVRDPLLSLGLKDPVERLAEIKANDPRRRALIAVFEAWWTAHEDSLIKATDLASEVLEQIDSRSVRKPDGLQFSRQRVAGFLGTHTGTFVGGYRLAKVMLGPPSKEIAHYKLTREASI